MNDDEQHEQRVRTALWMFATAGRLAAREAAKEAKRMVLAGNDRVADVLANGLARIDRLVPYKAKPPEPK